MAVAAFGDLSTEDRRQAVHQAFHSDPRHSDAKSVFRELAIIGSDDVYRAAVPVYEQLRVIRDTLALQAITADSGEYKHVAEPFFFLLEALQQLMRADPQPTSRRQGKRTAKMLKENLADESVALGGS